MTATAKLTPGILAIAFVIGTLLGPLSTLRDITPDQLQAQSYWLDVLAAGVRAAAAAGVAIAGIVAAALGLPMVQNRKGDGDAPVNPGGTP